MGRKPVRLLERPWSSKDKIWKEFDMEKNIDDLLGRISPDLVANYERKNLDGLTLEGVNNKYKTVEGGEVRNLNDRWFKLLMWVSAISGVAALTISLVFKLPNYSIVPMLVLWGPAFLYFMIFVRRKIKSGEETISRCGGIISSFRSSVTGIQYGHDEHTQTTEKSIRKALVLRAMDILRTQELFDEACLKDGKDIDEILRLGKQVKLHKQELDVASVCAGKFSLCYDNMDLFADAKKY